jgi:REP element-mobilizing transposase RayT
MGKKFKNYRSGSNRLRDYDYSLCGAYFVTIATSKFQNIFGDIYQGVVSLNKMGKIAHNEWIGIDRIRPYALIDEFVIMPNHMHGILIIDDKIMELKSKGSSSNQFISPSHNLGSIVRGYKSRVTSLIRKHTNDVNFTVWQSNYYDHIIRDKENLKRIRKYIYDNPAKWDSKKELDY